MILAGVLGLLLLWPNTERTRLMTRASPKPGFV
jgi:hypothetical protein